VSSSMVISVPISMIGGVMSKTVMITVSVSQLPDVSVTIRVTVYSPGAA
jgi:hypothetical protein